MTIRKLVAASILAIMALLPMQVRADADDLTAAQDCLLEGSINLNLSGTPENGWLNGSVGNEFINWNVFYGRIQAWVGNRMTTLDIMRSPYGQDMEISGWIGGSYIRWRSMGNWFTGYQPCITQ